MHRLRVYSPHPKSFFFTANNWDHKRKKRQFIKCDNKINTVKFSSNVFGFGGFAKWHIKMVLL